MASLRRAGAYSRKIARPFTRKSRNRKKAYIKTIPGSKLVKFEMGKGKLYRAGEFKYIVKLVSKDKVQIRDNALEACRTYVNKQLDQELQGRYYFAIKVYPHHLLRENKTAAGAGADRLSSGMKHSFGIIIGRAAMVSPGQTVLLAACATEKDARFAKTVLAKVKPKIASKAKVTFEKVE
tara:strand:- start:559 stop:1098 length:540 start_codon:yes stop_codon:yes gene_type:complete